MIYTEEMKQVIESQGMMVIEFKKIVKKSMIILNNFALALAEVVKSMINALKPMIDKLNEYFKIHVEIKKEHKHLLYLKIDNEYSVFIKRPIITHCRNNC